MPIAAMIGVICIGLGAIISCFNFYLSFVRYLIYRVRGKNTESYQWVSGIPVFGSLLLWISIPLLVNYPTLVWIAIVLSLMDSGGIHWLACLLILRQIKKRSQQNQA